MRNNELGRDAIIIGEVIEDEEIFISFGTSISPCVIRPIDETARNYTYMILPIRMKEE